MSTSGTSLSIRRESIMPAEKLQEMQIANGSLHNNPDKEYYNFSYKVRHNPSNMWIYFEIKQNKNIFC